MTSPIVLDLPLAPSVNGAWANVRGKGRVKTQPYKVWINAAGWEVNAARAGSISGPYRVLILVPLAMAGDADNRVKATLDLLVRQGITPDDRHAQSVQVKRDPDVPAGRMQVVISAHGGAG